MMRVLLNAISGKKGAGGGFQIACNFIKTAIHDTTIEWYFVVSSDLDAQIREDVTDNIQERYFVFPTQPNIHYISVARLLRKLENQINPDLVYSILAPSYFFFCHTEVMRSCNAWETCVESGDKVYKLCMPDLRRKIRFFVKIFVMERPLLKRGDYFITQSQWVKEGIRKVTGVSEEKICVIPSALPPLFRDIKVANHKSIKFFNIIFVAAPFPHKNHAIIPQVAYNLIHKHQFNSFKFIVTIPKGTPEELSFLNQINQLDVSDYIENVGTQLQSDLISLYSRCQIGFFPSLLETFSTTLLEYMAFKLPIVASNLPFNTEVAGDSALYYSAYSAENAASTIYDLVSNSELYESLESRGQKRLLNFIDYNRHYSATIRFLTDVTK